MSLITDDLLFPTEFACCNEQGVKIFEADLTSGSSATLESNQVVMMSDLLQRFYTLIQEMKHAYSKVL